MYASMKCKYNCITISSDVFNYIAINFGACNLDKFVKGFIFVTEKLLATTNKHKFLKSFIKQLVFFRAKYFSCYSK